MKPLSKPIATWILCVLLAIVTAALWGCTKYSTQTFSFPGSIAGLPHADGAAAAPAGWAAADELWVIARSTKSSDATEQPGSGALMAELEGEQIPMPLRHTAVNASIAGFIAQVRVTQQFDNPYDRKIEAVYLFPLPHNAAVNEFVMTIGERRIRGIIREREEAERIYHEARSQGYVASLLTEERPNIFTQKVANLEPGKAIDVSLTYVHPLEFMDGWYEFVFPMVVGPRFNPLGSTDGIAAVSARGRTEANQKNSVHYLRPTERSGHDIDLVAEVDAGVRIEEFQCKTHPISHQASSPEQLRIELNPEDRLPNRDFVFRYRVGAGQVKTGLLTHRDEQGGYFTLALYPPQELAHLPRQPLELVFVLDCSGSMSGRPLQQAKAAVQRGLRLLQPGDSFQLINFSATTGSLGPAPLEANAYTIRQGLDYLASLNSEGGTMMIHGIRAALDFPHDPKRLRFVCFLTDGFIGNEAEILAEIHRRLGPSRIFSFGIGSSVNRYLMDQMAKTGRGAVAYLGPEDEAAEIMESFFERISHPALTDLQIDWGGLAVAEVYPRVLPDLFPGRPLLISGRFSGQASTAVRIRGSAAGERIEVETPVTLEELSARRPALASVWARSKIAGLSEELIQTGNRKLLQNIQQVALDYGLVSARTAFVAVDSSRTTEGDSVTVPVAVPVPKGVSYDKTVNEN